MAEYSLNIKIDEGVDNRLRITVEDDAGRKKEIVAWSYEGLRRI